MYSSRDKEDHIPIAWVETKPGQDLKGVINGEYNSRSGEITIRLD